MRAGTVRSPAHFSLVPAYTFYSRPPQPHLLVADQQILITVSAWPLHSTWIASEPHTSFNLYMHMGLLPPHVPFYRLSWLLINGTWLIINRISLLPASELTCLYCRPESREIDVSWSPLKGLGIILFIIIFSISLDLISNNWSTSKI